MDQDDRIADLCWEFDIACRGSPRLDLREFLVRHGIDADATTRTSELVVELLRCAAGHWDLDTLVRVGVKFLGGAAEDAKMWSSVLRDYYANNLSRGNQLAWDHLASYGFEADQVRVKLDDDVLWLGQIVGTKWVIIQRIGEGTCGVVYAARHVHTGEPVAVKSPKEASGQGAQLLRSEAEALLQLDHLHILRVREAVERDGYPLLITDHVPGGALRDRLRQKRLPIPDVVRIASQVASALQHANARRLYHRDLKPENVLLDEKGNAIVADFGLVLGRSQSWSHQAVPGGSWPYMDFGSHVDLIDNVDSRTDVFALGALLLEMLTGYPPSVPGASREESVVNSIVIGQISPPFPDDIPQTLRSICLRCLAAKPEHRYECPGDVQAALEGVREQSVETTTATETQDAKCTTKYKGS